jgi:hypothetical protein
MKKYEGQITEMANNNFAEIIVKTTYGILLHQKRFLKPS